MTRHMSLFLKFVLEASHIYHVRFSSVFCLLLVMCVTIHAFTE